MGGLCPDSPLLPSHFGTSEAGEVGWPAWRGQEGSTWAEGVRTAQHVLGPGMWIRQVCSFFLVLSVPKSGC